jgi:uncharacterized membrane protein (DUF4010 family)
MHAIGAVGLSLALGLLIGVQRGWALRNDPPGSRFAGIRTFGLLGLTGGVAGHIRIVDNGISLIIMGAASALILSGYIGTLRRNSNISGTASLVAMLTLGCGFLATTEQGQLATIVAAVTTLVLASRSRLHGWVKQLSETEVIAIARFGLIALAILPLLPDHAYGPLDAWNPRQLWMVVVMVSGFSFAGYAAAKRLGASRGTIVTAAAGAMVSSTAVTAALATRLRSDAESAPVLVAGISMASTVMFLRVMILVGLLVPFALPTLMMLVAPAAAVSALATLWNLRAAGSIPTAAPQELPVRNPFDLGPAFLLTALVMILSLASRWVLHGFGDAGLATVLALSGMVDVDSAIITMGGLAHGSLDPQAAGLVLAAPVMLNSLVKAGVAIGIAGWHRGWRAALPLVASVIAGLLMLPVMLIGATIAGQ